MRLTVTLLLPVSFVNLPLGITHVPSPRSYGSYHLRYSRTTERSEERTGMGAVRVRSLVTFILSSFSPFTLVTLGTDSHRPLRVSSLHLTVTGLAP